AAQLQQALVNLVLNARDAMPDGGTLRIEADARADDAQTAGVEVAVIDEGRGMSEETQARMFEPFFTTKHKSAGAGLGLPMADGIVRQHGGSIRVVSADGAGTSVFVWLPATERTREVRAEVEDRPLTVLLVDDESMIRKVAGRVFAAAGHTVVPAESAEEALLLLEDPELRYDVMVTDVIMPGLHGPELAERVR
ncbi:MAG: ATP-binding protein, partial [Bacteroidota bacterium]